LEASKARRGVLMPVNDRSYLEGRKPVECTTSRVDSDGRAIASLKDGANCFDVAIPNAPEGEVIVYLRNECSSRAAPGTGREMGIVVFDK
jgi:hypothetical protein